MVAGGQAGVFHAGFAGDARQPFCVELAGIPQAGGLFIFDGIHVIAEEHLLATADGGIRPPVDEHAVARLLEPLPLFGQIELLIHILILRFAMSESGRAGINRALPLADKYYARCSMVLSTS